MECLNIITYNLCWEALEAQPIGRAKIDMSHCNVDNRNQCMSNMATILLNGSPTKHYDIMCLQEIIEDKPTQWPKFLADIRQIMSDFSRNYGWISSKTHSNAGTMVIYNKHAFTLKYQMSGELETPDISLKKKVGGRSYQVVVFQENLVVVNVHFPHEEDIKPHIHFERHMAGLLNKELLQVPELADPNYQIIMAGDFNRDPRNFIQGVLAGLQRSFYIPHFTLETCCDPEPVGLMGGYRKGIDYIFNTISNPVFYGTIPREMLKLDKRGNKMTSDHLPIIAEIPIRLTLSTKATRDWLAVKKLVEEDTPHSRSILNKIRINPYTFQIVPGGNNRRMPHFGFANLPEMPKIVEDIYQYFKGKK